MIYCICGKQTTEESTYYQHWNSKTYQYFCSFDCMEHFMYFSIVLQQLEILFPRIQANRLKIYSDVKGIILDYLIGCDNCDCFIGFNHTNIECEIYLNKWILKR